MIAELLGSAQATTGTVEGFTKMAGLWKVCFFGEGDNDLKVATLIHRLELKVGSNTIRHYGQGCSRSRYP